MAEAGQNRPSHKLDALVGLSVLHSAIVLDRLSTMKDDLRQFREEGCNHKDIVFDSVLPLQPLKESDCHNLKWCTGDLKPNLTYGTKSTFILYVITP